MGLCVEHAMWQIYRHVKLCPSVISYVSVNNALPYFQPINSPPRHIYSSRTTPQHLNRLRIPLQTANMETSLMYYPMEYDYEFMPSRASLRETFRFDEELYADEKLLVTPSSLIVRQPRKRKRNIRIDDVGFVLMPELRFIRTRWWSSRKSPVNLTIEVYQERGDVRNIHLLVKDPRTVVDAVERAKNIYY